MLKLWKWYQNCLAVNPVKTQVISSGFLWGTGDIAAQCITHSTSKKHLQLADTDEELKINWKRVAITSMFGFGFVGPVGHFWYENLDKFIRLRLQLPAKSARFVATKVAMDSIIFGPFDLFAFFTYMGFAAGKNAAQVKESLKRDFVPALILEGGIWPIVQVGNFRYVPVRNQLLYVNIFCLLDSAFFIMGGATTGRSLEAVVQFFSFFREQRRQGRLIVLTYQSRIIPSSVIILAEFNLQRITNNPKSQMQFFLKLEF